MFLFFYLGSASLFLIFLLYQPTVYLACLIFSCWTEGSILIMCIDPFSFQFQSLRELMQLPWFFILLFRFLYHFFTMSLLKSAQEIFFSVFFKQHRNLYSIYICSSFIGSRESHNTKVPAIRQELFHYVQTRTPTKNVSMQIRANKAMGKERSFPARWVSVEFYARRMPDSYHTYL